LSDFTFLPVLARIALVGLLVRIFSFVLLLLNTGAGLGIYE
jgi:hypothetical protein